MPETMDLTNALRRADLWRVLALTFSPPIAQGMEDLQDLSRELADGLGAESHPLHAGVTDVAVHAAKVDVVELEHEHNALFSMDVLVPAYEGSYQRIERGAVVGDVAGYYAAFELETADKSGPPDSLWNELAFLAWLSVKEGYALQQGWEEPLAVTREAGKRFIQDHLGRWVGAFCTRLLHATSNPLYVNAAHLLLATVSLTADEWEVGEIRPLTTGPAPEEPDQVACPAVCGTTPELPIPGSVAGHG